MFLGFFQVSTCSWWTSACTSKELAHGAPGERSALDQEIVFLNCPLKFPPFTRLNIVWAKVHAHILTLDWKEALLKHVPILTFIVALWFQRGSFAGKSSFCTRNFCSSQSKLFWDCIYALYYLIYALLEFCFVAPIFNLGVKDLRSQPCSALINGPNKNSWK